jgi:hypothetical protein
MTTGGGASFTLVTQPANLSAAQATCQAGGGHLARYSSLLEQREVEAFFTAAGGQGAACPCCPAAGGCALRGPGR